MASDILVKPSVLLTIGCDGMMDDFLVWSWWEFLAHITLSWIVDVYVLPFSGVKFQRPGLIYCSWGDWTSKRRLHMYAPVGYISNTTLLFVIQCTGIWAQCSFIWIMVAITTSRCTICCIYLDNNDKTINYPQMSTVANTESIICCQKMKKAAYKYTEHTYA